MRKLEKLEVLREMKLQFEKSMNNHKQMASDAEERLNAINDLIREMQERRTSC